MSLKRQKQWERRIVGCAGVLILLLAVGALCAFGAEMLRPDSGAAAGVMLPMLGAVAGTATLTDEQFREKVLGGVEDLQGRQKEFKREFDDMQAATKNAIGDLTAMRDEVNKLKDVSNGQAAISQKLQTALALLDGERRQFAGDSIARFVTNPRTNAWLNGHMRRAGGLPMTPEQKTAITGVDSGIGGAVTPQETSRMIYDALLEYGQWNTLGVFPVGSRTQVIPIVTARPTANWVAQGAQITEGAMTGSSNTLTIKEAAAWIPVSLALLEDAETDMAGYVLRQLAQAVAYRLDWACFAADGTDDTTDGAYTGIAAGGTAATSANGNTTVAALDLEDFVRCLTTVSAAVLQRNAKWWIHPTILAKIVQIRDSNGRPIFQTALEAPAPGAIGSILGYPVVVAGAMPSTDSAGNVVAVFGEPEAGVVGLRRTFDFARSDEFQFDYVRAAFRVVIRAGFKIQAATSFADLTLAAS